MHSEIIYAKPPMTVDETQPIEQKLVRYRCTCGRDVFLDKRVGGQCPGCQRIVSTKLLNNVLAATITISGTQEDVEGSHHEFDVLSDPREVIGQNYGHYTILRPLGHGGAGFVYQALDNSLQRYVAVKILKGFQNDSPYFRVDSQAENADVLLQEAISQARVAHPNIVTIYYVGKEQGVPFYAMELIDGISLSERIRAGSIDFHEICEVAEHIVEALTFSYGLDIIHGDIKPSNILLPRTGGAKLSDFGLARRASEENKLATGGTPNYLAPELLFGGSPSKQSDMYALGVTLFEMTFGKLPVPISGGSISDWQSVHHEAEIEFPVVWPENLPPQWEDFLARLLAKEPENRFPSYQQLTAQLNKLRPRDKIRARPVPRLIAAVIDCLTVILFMIPLRLTISNELAESNAFWKGLVLVTGFAPILIYTLVEFFWRQSVGRRLMQLRVLNRFGMIPTGRKMAMRSVLRLLLPWTMAAVQMSLWVPWRQWDTVPVLLAGGTVIFVLLDTASLLLSENKQSLHDLIFETQVVLDT